MSVLIKKITRHTKKQERIAHSKEWNNLWGSADIEVKKKLRQILKQLY